MRGSRSSYKEIEVEGKNQIKGTGSGTRGFEDLDETTSELCFVLS